MLDWYPVGANSITDECRFPFELFLNILVGRPDRLALVRIAMPREAGPEIPDSGAAEKFAQAFYPFLIKALAD